MALNKNTLKQNLIDNFTNVRDNVKSQRDSAKGFATAIVDYAKEAEVIVTTPPSTPASPPYPASHVIGRKVKVSGATLSPGKAAMESQIMASFKLMDPTMNLISLSIVTFAALMLNFRTGSINAVGTTLMAAPPIFLPSTKKGMDGGSIVDVCNEMAKAIDTSFKASMFTGIVTAGSAVIPAPLVGTLV